MGTGAFVFCGKTCEHADARAALSTQARAAACLQVVCLLPSVVKEQSPFTSLVGLEKNCSHYTSRYHFGRAHEEVHPHPVCVGKRRGTAALLHRASVVLYATTSYFIIGLDLVFQRF